jgi:replicative DNA helicase
VDYREAYDLIMSAYVAKATAGNNMGLMLGWPTLDKMTGGLSIGDLISFIGRPAMGKSWFMLYMALHAWSQGKVPMFVSMEMQPLIIQQRLLAIQAELPFSGLRDGALTTADYKKMKTLMLANKHGTTPFHVIDGNLTATVSDIYTLARQLKPDLVIIDGAYLLKHPTERDRFKRVAENADLIKQQICALAPTLCSWQFARPQKGNKSSKVKEAPTLDDIGYTDAIGQLSALVCGIMQPESAETTKQREVLILKGRNGEAGQFNVNWDFDFTTNFSEVTGELEASTKFADE